MSPPGLRNKLKVNDPAGSKSPSNYEDTEVTIRALKTEINANIASLHRSSEENFAKLLKSFEERILQRVSDITAEFTNLRTEVHSTKTKLVSVTRRCESLEAELSKTRVSLNSYENSLVASDIVVGNIPNTHDATAVVGNLLSKISCHDVGVRKAFRTKKTNDNAKSVPIIVKMHSADDRVKVMQALALFRKKNNNQLLLSDLGLPGDASIYLHECLTSLNRELLRSALHYKATKILASAFSLRGSVFVRVKINDKAIKINSIEELVNIVGGA